MKKAKKKRRRKRSLKARMRPLIWLAFLGLIFAAIYYILSLPIWQIKDVVVDGAQMLSAQEVRALAGIPISENLFFADYSRARANLSKITPIKSFKLYRIPPSTVLIRITEREPIATLTIKNRSLFVDQEGFILNHSENLALDVSNLADLPVISGVSAKNLAANDKVDAKTAKVIRDVVLKLSQYLALKKIQLELRDMSQMTLLLDDVLKVKLGDTERLKRKMTVFRALLAEISGQWSRVAYIDVRFPDNPVINYR